MPCEHEAYGASPQIVCEEIFRKRILVEAARDVADRSPVTAILGLRACTACGQMLILAGITSPTEWRLTARQTIEALGLTHAFGAFVICGSDPTHVVAGWTDGAHEQAMAFRIGGDDVEGREEMEAILPYAWPTSVAWAETMAPSERIVSVLNDFADRCGWEVILSGERDGEQGLWVRREASWLPFSPPGAPDG